MTALAIYWNPSEQQPLGELAFKTYLFDIWACGFVLRVFAHPYGIGHMITPSVCVKGGLYLVDMT